MSSTLVLKLLVGWLTDRCAGSAAVAPTLHFFRKPALGVFWSSAGEMAVTVLFSAKPHCRTYPQEAVPHLPPPHPQMGRQEMVPSIRQVPGPCHASWPMALDSAVSASSTSVLPAPLQCIKTILMQLCVDSDTWNLHAPQQPGCTFITLFF